MYVSKGLKYTAQQFNNPQYVAAIRIQFGWGKKKRSVWWVAARTACDLASISNL